MLPRQSRSLGNYRQSSVRLSPWVRCRQTCGRRSWYRYRRRSRSPCRPSRPHSALRCSTNSCEPPARLQGLLSFPRSRAAFMPWNDGHQTWQSGARTQQVGANLCQVGPRQASRRARRTRYAASGAQSPMVASTRRCGAKATGKIPEQTAYRWNVKIGRWPGVGRGRVLRLVPRRQR